MDWSVFLSAFVLVFVAELGDKTQLAVVTQTCRFRLTWPVFLGASLALVAVTAIGAAGGEVLARLVPPQWVRAAAAAAFVFAGLWVARGAVRGQASPTGEAGDPASAAEDDCVDTTGGWDWKAFGSTFALLFAAELGDKTQLAVLTLSGQSQAPWPVFAGASLALTTLTALAVLGGEGLSRRVPQRALLWASALTFVVVGLSMGLGL
jgi:putative Ca2+/H+ antiporter (TMEM165/GDT1 family)